jgi:hypothetical protein
MSRLRRLNSGCNLPSVAAEVLELRALPSSGGVAVHAAEHHAALRTQAIEPLAFHATVEAAVAINSQTATIIQGLGKMTVSTLTPIVGSKVTVKVNFPQTGPGTDRESLAVTFSGKVASVTPNGSQFFFGITPTGSSLTLKFELGNHHVTAKALPDGSDWHLVLENGAFQSVNETFKFPPTATPELAGLPVFIAVAL